MTEENEIEVTEDVIPSELDTLKQRADMMGIKYNRNIGVDKLKDKIDRHLSGDTSDDVSEEVTGIKSKAFKPDGKTMLTREQFLRETENRKRKSINNLVRIRVTCMNPNKTDWEGEIISVGSAKYGTFKKYVPFNADEGYHVPKIIYEAMKERKYTAFTTVRGPRGEKIRKGKLVPEFAIEVLPPLTKEELKDLAQRQAMAGSVD